MEEPKAILQRARTAQERIDRRRAELRRLREMETYISATDYSVARVRASSGRGSVERIATSGKLEKVERKIREDISELEEAKLEAIAMISLLEDPRDTEILWEYYIHAAKNWQEAASAVGYSKEYAIRRHGWALQKLQAILKSGH